MATRHQYYQALKLESTNILEAEIITTGGCVIPTTLLSKQTQMLLLPILGNDKEVFQAVSVNVDGTKYISASCVILSSADDYYKFGKISCCFVLRGIVYLLCQILHVLEYSRHYHAYLVQETDSLTLVKPCELLDHHPLGIYPKDGENYVAVKYDVKYN